MRSKGYGSWLVCVCLSVSVHGYSGTTGWHMSDTSGFRTMRSWKIKRRFSTNDCIHEIWHENKRIKPIHTSNNVYTTTCRWMYLLVLRQNQKSFNSLKPLHLKVTTLFARLSAFWLLQSTPTGLKNSSRTCAHLVYMWQSRTCGARSKGYILETL